MPLIEKKTPKLIHLKTETNNAFDTISATSTHSNCSTMTTLAQFIEFFNFCECKLSVFDLLRVYFFAVIQKPLKFSRKSKSKPNISKIRTKTKIFLKIKAQLNYNLRDTLRDTLPNEEKNFFEIFNLMERRDSTEAFLWSKFTEIWKSEVVEVKKLILENSIQSWLNIST